MSQSKKRKNDLSDLSAMEMASMLVATAVSGKQSGHTIRVSHAAVGSHRGIMIWLPGFEMRDGNVLPVAQKENVHEKVS